MAIPEHPNRQDDDDDYHAGTMMTNHHAETMMTDHHAETMMTNHHAETRIDSDSERSDAEENPDPAFTRIEIMVLMHESGLASLAQSHLSDPMPHVAPP